MTHEINYNVMLDNGQTVCQYILSEREKGHSFGRISDDLSFYFGIDISESALRHRSNNGGFTEDAPTKTYGYSCARCGSVSVIEHGAIRHMDDIIRTKQCKSCGFQWKTVEIDLDMYNSIMHGNTKHKDVDLRSKRSGKRKK